MADQAQFQRNANVALLGRPEYRPATEKPASGNDRSFDIHPGGNGLVNFNPITSRHIAAWILYVPTLRLSREATIAPSRARTNLETG